MESEKGRGEFTQSIFTCNKSFFSFEGQALMYCNCRLTLHHLIRKPLLHESNPRDKKNKRSGSTKAS